jgi:hypothetical protein
VATNGQHYESFIVRVVLNDDDGSIRDTRMEHIGTGEVRRWAGWEHNAMLGFIKEAAAPNAPPVPLAAPTGPLGAGPHPGSEPESVAEPGLLAPLVKLRADSTLLRAAQPFTVTLSLDLTKVAPQSERLIYSATVVARQLGGRSSRTLASPRGLLKTACATTFTIDAEGLPPGSYLLEAAVSLRAAGASHGGVAAMAEGIMLRVLPS